MDKEEIKTRLSGYRPDLYDDRDPQIAGALARAKEDPELKAWLEEEIAFDYRFGATLKCTPADRSGLDELLATGRRELLVARPRAFRKTALLAAAAVLVLSAISVKYFFFPPPVQFPALGERSASGFRDHMAYFATQRFVLDETTSDLEQARAWLAERDLPVYGTTPSQIARFKGMGCKAIDWNGLKVSLVCFLNKDDELVHLFVINTGVFPRVDPVRLGTLTRRHGLETQGWSDREFVYLLVGSEPGVSLQGLL